MYNDFIEEKLEDDPRLFKGEKMSITMLYELIQEDPPSSIETFGNPYKLNSYLFGWVNWPTVCEISVAFYLFYNNKYNKYHTRRKKFECDINKNKFV